MGAWPQLRESRTVRPGGAAGTAAGTVVRCGLMDAMLADLAVSVVYFFREPLDEQRLADGLARALEQIPVFGGRLRTTEAAGGDVLEIVCDGSGVPMDSYDVDETLAEAMSRVTLPGAELVDHVRASEARGGGLPLLTVRLSRLADGGTALGLSWHHALGDVQTFMLLMRAWSAAVEGLRLPEVELVADHDAYLDRVLPPEDCGRPGFRLPGPEEAELLAREVAFSVRANRTVQVYFSEAETERMRQAFIEAAGRKLSTSDVLCAHVVCTIRELDDDAEARELTVPVNVRRPLDLPATVVGNLLSEIHLDCAGGAAPERLAVELREAVEDFTASHLNLRANIRFLEAIGRDRLGDCAPLGFDPARRRLTFSNWSRFGAYEISFGGRRPVFFSPAANLQLPWVSWMVEGFEGTGSLFTVVLPTRLAGRLRSAEGRAALHRHRSDQDPLPPLAEAVRKLA
ncbi:acyltransferase [Streptacidiphilus cavernicola]|uniref:Acyltransferase n=1 Tax=Streptacidiphilus cavernicola TaxID=3342716 RepID=A0ABV6W114_9ACTN